MSREAHVRFWERVGVKFPCATRQHRLFSFITQNWRAKPLLSYRVIVDLIGATTTTTGLTVRCELDDKSYPKGIVVSDEDMQNLNIQHADFHGEWNYTIAPSTQNIRAVDS
jgi:Rhodopirellula transposase DDE domain